MVFTRVIAPPHALLPLTLRIAPLPPMPVPRMLVIASAPTLIPPCNSIAAPFATVNPLVVAPSALPCCKLSTPALTVVSPV